MVTVRERDMMGAFVERYAAESQRTCDAHARDAYACERAGALAALGAHVRRLPLDDRRLEALRSLCCTDLEGRPLDGFLAGDRVAHAVERLSFNGDVSDLDACVTRLVDLAQEDRQAWIEYAATWATPGGAVAAG